MLDLKEIEASVKRIVACHFGKEDFEILPTMKFEDDLKADSLDVVELAMAFEDEFKVDYSNDEIYCLDNVRSAVISIHKKLTKSSEGA